MVVYLPINTSDISSLSGNDIPDLMVSLVNLLARHELRPINFKIIHGKWLIYCKYGQGVIYK